MPPRTLFGTPRDVYVPCPQCGTSPSELLKQMRAVRVLRCKVCSTLWREPLPPGRAIAAAPPERRRPDADDATGPPATADGSGPAIQLVRVRDRRKTSDRRRLGYGGRRREDVKRPSALSRRPPREDPDKKPRG